MDVQSVLPQSLKDGLTERILHLLSDNVFSICGVLFICTVAAIALVSIINSFREDSEGFTTDQLKKRRRQSQALGHLLGFVLSVGGVYTYLTGGFAAKAFLAIILASIGGGATPYTYDLFWWIRQTVVPALLGKKPDDAKPDDPPK